MFGNAKAFISHTVADHPRCDVLLAALDAWQVDYWYDLQDLSAGQNLLAYIQRSLADRDIFIRVCTPAAAGSSWMAQEQTLARSLKPPNRSGQRLMINLILEPGYQLTADEGRDVVIDATQLPMEEWVRKLRMALGVPARDQRVGRRAVIALGAVSVAALGTAGYVGRLLLSPTVAQGFRPQTALTTPTPQPSAARVLWTYTIGTDATDRNGTSLSANATGLYGVTSHIMFSLGLSDGRLRWQHFGFFAHGAPALTADNLYALGELNGDSQTLYLFAINLQDGSERKHIAVEHTDTTTVGESTMTVVPMGSAIVMQYDGILGVLNADSGTFLWEPRQENSAGPQGTSSYLVITAPEVVNGIIYVGLTDGNLYAYDLATGVLRWTAAQFATPAAIQSTPTVVGETLYIGRNDGYCYAFDTKTHQLAWQTQLPTASSAGASGEQVVAAPTVADGVVYIAGGSLQAGVDALWALDATSGHLRWQVNPSLSVRSGNLTAYPITSQPAVLDSRVYVTGKLAPTDSTSIDVLYALDSGDGRELWHFEAPGYGTVNDSAPVLPSTPVIANQVVYFASSDGTVYALSLA